MENSVKKYILQLLEQKGPLPESRLVDDYRFLDTGHIDSIGLIKFIVNIENKYDIEFSDQDILQDNFRTVQGLCELIDEKIKANAMSELAG